MKKKILIADDEVGFQVLFRHLLEPMGYSVVTAGNGQEAVKLVNEEDIALVFLDNHMPKLTGPEALKCIRQNKPSQPVVILSSSFERDAVETNVKDLGANAFFQKPFNIQNIFQIVDQLVK